MCPYPMQIKIGSPATGSDFFPRDLAVKRLISALEAEYVLFLAPRRTGKTSVLLHLRDRAPVPTVFLDLEGFSHPRLWIEAMASELSRMRDQPWLQKAKQAGAFLERLESEFLQIREADWLDKANRLMESLHGLDTPVWFLLDEFPVMIDQIAKTHGAALADTALSWIRRCRQQNAGSPVRFLLTGSIGLDSVLRKYGIRGSANDLRRIELPPLRRDEADDRDEALQLALKLAGDNGVPLNAVLAREYLQRLGLAVWPYFIQLFVAELQEAEATPENPVDLDRIYEQVAFGRRNQYADNMRSRLRDIFNDTEAALARELLRLAAALDHGLPGEELRARLARFADEDFGYVLEVLQHDGYLTETGDGRILFFSNLLRDYWRRKGWV
jgi:hypothetical protein